MVPTNGFLSKASQLKDKCQTFSRPRSGDVLDRLHSWDSSDLRQRAVLLDTPTYPVNILQQQQQAPLQYIIRKASQSKDKCQTFSRPRSGDVLDGPHSWGSSDLRQCAVLLDTYTYPASYAPSDQSRQHARSTVPAVRLADNDLRHQISTAQPTSGAQAQPDNHRGYRLFTARNGAADFLDTTRAAKRRSRRQRTTAELFEASKATHRLCADLQSTLCEAQARNARMAEMLIRFSPGELYPTASTVPYTSAPATGQSTAEVLPTSTTPSVTAATPAASLAPTTTGEPDNRGHRLFTARNGAADFLDTPRAAKRRSRRQRTNAELFEATKTTHRLRADLQSTLCEAQASHARMAETLFRFSSGGLCPSYPTAPCTSAPATGQSTAEALLMPTTPSATAAAPAAPPAPTTTGESSAAVPPTSTPLPAAAATPASSGPGTPAEPSPAMAATSLVVPRPSPADCGAAVYTENFPLISIVTGPLASLAPPLNPTFPAKGVDTPPPLTVVTLASCHTTAALPHIATPIMPDMVSHLVFPLSDGGPPAPTLPLPTAPAATFSSYNPFRPSHAHEPALSRPPLSGPSRGVDDFSTGCTPHTDTAQSTLGTPLGSCLPCAGCDPCYYHDPTPATLVQRPLGSGLMPGDSLAPCLTSPPQVGPQLLATPSRLSATAALLECDLSADELTEAPQDPVPDSTLYDSEPPSATGKGTSTPPQRGWAPGFRRDRGRPPRGGHHRKARPSDVNHDPSLLRLARSDLLSPSAGHRRRS